MKHIVKVGLTWTPFVAPLIDLVSHAESIKTRDLAVIELRRMLAAAGMQTPEAERLISAIAANPTDADLRERLYAAARTVDDKAAAS